MKAVSNYKSIVTHRGCAIHRDQDGGSCPMSQRSDRHSQAGEEGVGA